MRLFQGLVKKLNTGRGSSVIIALFVFLVCGIVSAVIITSSQASATRVEGRVDEQQAQIAAESMAEIISNDYSGMRFIAKKNGKDWIETSYSNTKEYIMGPSISADALNVCETGQIQPAVALQLSLTKIQSTNEKAADYYTNKISYDGSYYVMGADFSITYVISVKCGNSVQKISFIIPAAVTESSSSEIRTVTWGEAKLYKGDIIA